VASFVIAALVSAAARTHVDPSVMGLIFALAVLAVGWFGGLVYAIPAGLATVLAFYWYLLPPFDALADTSTANLVALGAFVVPTLVGTTIANARARDAQERIVELTASRARVIAAADDDRRRFERGLHDGIQQRLVSLALELRTADSMASPRDAELRDQLSRITEELTNALDEVRELSRGIHPAILSEGGLGPALKALARRSVVPVALDLAVEARLDQRIEVAAYHVASEGLANAAKHAHASAVRLGVRCEEGALVLSVSDDGIGGADLARGSGLIGLTDRVEALGGTLSVWSVLGEGTSLFVRLPVV
jgi:signal transduction histidine kinase